jgi:uncharacterized metal-binding protein
VHTKHVKAANTPNIHTCNNSSSSGQLGDQESAAVKKAHHGAASNTYCTC